MSLPEVAETRDNGCIKADCIVTLPCPNKHPPKTEDGYCVSYNNGTRRNSVKVKK